MRAGRLGLLGQMALAIVLVGGCGASTTVAPATTPGAASTSVPSSRTPAPVETPFNWSTDPAAPKAAEQFLAAAAQVDAKTAAAFKRYPILPVLGLATGRSYFRLAAAAEREFAAAVKRIAFPSGMGPDVKDLLDTEATLVDLETKASKAKTLDALGVLVRKIVRASRAAGTASNVVRHDLALPGAPL